MLAPIYRCPTAFNLLLHIAPPSRCSLWPNLQPPSLTPLLSSILWLLGFPCLPNPPPSSSPAPYLHFPSPRDRFPSKPQAQVPLLRRGRSHVGQGWEGAASRAQQRPFSQQPLSYHHQSGPGLKTEHDLWGGVSAQLLVPWPLPSTSLSCPQPPSLSTLFFAPLLPSSTRTFPHPPFPGHQSHTTEESGRR